MEFSDPGCEVWVCSCGQMVQEPGKCFACLREEIRPVLLPMDRLSPVILSLCVLVGVGWMVATGLVIYAAWLCFHTFH